MSAEPLFSEETIYFAIAAKWESLKPPWSRSAPVIRPGLSGVTVLFFD
jgi:hypothetical protein